MNEQDFRILLESIPDSYDDFVSGLMHSLKTDEDRQLIADYILRKDKVDTSSVLDYFSDEIRHIPKFE